MKGGAKGKSAITCHYCGEPGHKVVNCFKMTPEKREQQIEQATKKYEVRNGMVGGCVVMGNGSGRVDRRRSGE